MKSLVLSGYNLASNREKSTTLTLIKLEFSQLTIK